MEGNGRSKPPSTPHKLLLAAACGMRGYLALALILAGRIPQGSFLRLTTMALESGALRSAQQVLDFWFGDRSQLNSRDFLQSRMKLWFSGTPEFEQVQKENKELMDAAIRGELVDESWQTPSGLLAKIILADQFPRVVYKATAGAFSGEAVALAAAHTIIEKNWFVSEFQPAERIFVTVPLMHSESMADHELLATLIEVMASNCPEDLVSLVCPRRSVDEHSAVIRRFGRYPSRNMALGRPSTAEEEAYLQSPDLPGWAKSQLKN